jgi:DNA-binding response OmpR family regulator
VLEEAKESVQALEDGVGWGSPMGGAVRVQEAEAIARRAEQVLVVGDDEDLRARLATDLTVLGYRPVLAGTREPPPPTPPVALVGAATGPKETIRMSEELRSAEGFRHLPLVWLVDPMDLWVLAGREHLCDEFVRLPYVAEELAARLRLLSLKTGRDGPDVIRRGPLRLNTSTHLVMMDGRSMDLTYMEYELLKLLASSPGRVFTREDILARVWGYDYFGGMRTVDVHIRRLRAKFGPDHASLIQTIRSVGYRFAQVRG